MQRAVGADEMLDIAFRNPAPFTVFREKTLLSGPVLVSQTHGFNLLDDGEILVRMRTIVRINIGNDYGFSSEKVGVCHKSGLSLITLLQTAFRLSSAAGCYKSKPSSTQARSEDGILQFLTQTGRANCSQRPKDRRIYPSFHSSIFPEEFTAKTTLYQPGDSPLDHPVTKKVATGQGRRKRNFPQRLGVIWASEGTSLVIAVDLLLQ